MKIAILTEKIYPFSIGGMEKQSYYLAKQLAQKKIRVHLIYAAPEDSNIQDHFTQEENKFIEPVNIPFPKTMRFPGHYIVASRWFSKRIWKYLKNTVNELDFIFAQGFTGWYYFLQKERNDSLPRCGVHLHGFEMYQRSPSLSYSIKAPLLRYAVNMNLKADLIYSYGGRIDTILKRLSVNRDRVRYFPNAVTNEWINKNIRPVQKKKKFVFVGRDERRKGIHELNAVLKKLTGKRLFECHLIGPVKAGNRIDHPDIIYHGPIYDEDVIRKYIQNSDVLLCPSYAEGMPNVILEAMASGLAVIASDTGAVSGLVNEETGWKIKAGDVKQLINAMVHAIDFPAEQLMKKKYAAQKKIKEHYLWEDVVSIFIENSLKDV